MRTHLANLAGTITAIVALTSINLCSAQETPADAKKTPTYTEPPELTSVSGRLVNDDESQVKAGVAYFIFQSRLNELPHEGTLERVKAISEKAVAIDEGGSFTLKLAPGNYSMVYDPTGNPASVPEPGPESMAVSKKMAPEKVQTRIAAIRENAQKGLPIVNGKIGEAFVVENRFIRPPVSDFGDISLGSDDSILILANNAEGKPVDFPVALRLRGKNGDIYEPHSPSISAPGEYSFYNAMPQSYQLFALGTKPKPGAGDEITTPTIADSQFIYDGSAIEHTVKITPGEPGAGERQAPPPPPATRP